MQIKMEITIFFSRSTQEHNPSNGGCLSAVRAAMYYLARSHLLPMLHNLGKIKITSDKIL